MFEIHPCTDEEKVKQLCADHQIAPKEGRILAMLATERGNEIGHGLFLLEEPVGVLVISLSEEQDKFLFDAVLRAGLNAACLQGFKDFILEESFARQNASRLLELGYQGNNAKDIEVFFASCRNCGKGTL